MTAPKSARTSPNDVVRSYDSPDYVPAPWMPDRPAEIEGRQPVGERLGYQGPDQGYVLRLSRRFHDRIVTGPAENVDDAIRGCINIGLRRASSFGRAPVIHDLTIAFTIWGWLDATPPADLIAARKRLFEGVSHGVHYSEGRLIADLVPESTLRMTPDAAVAAYAAGRWRELTGCPADS